MNDNGAAPAAPFVFSAEALMTLPDRVLSSLARGCQVALAVLIAFLAALESTGILHPASAIFGALWASISAIVVLQNDISATGSAARLRFWGTILGAVIAGGYLMIWPFSPLGLGVCIALAVAGEHLLNQNDGGRLAAITVTVILLQGEMNPGAHPLVTAGLRFFEACLGAASAVLVSWGWMRVAKYGRFGG